MRLLTLVGFDPAPVAWAAKAIRRRMTEASSPSTVYLLEKPGTSSKEPWPYLVQWLRKEGFHVEALTWEKAHTVGPDVVVNLTAGTKEELFRLYQLAQERNLRAFVLEAHASPPLLTWLGGQTEPLSDPDHLTPEDYASLYLEAQGARILGTAEASQIPQGLWGPVWYRVEMNGEEVLFAVRQGKPCVYADLPKKKLDFKDHLHLLARKAKGLGGQLVRVFTKVPPGRPQNENDRATLLQQAKEARVELVFPNAVPGQHFSPFSLPREGPVLLGLVSEQPVPILASFLAHTPKRVYLASTWDLEARLGRMRAAQRVFAELGAQVKVATISGPQAMAEVEALFRPVVKEAVARGLPMVANINGGTKLMALGLLRALHPDVAVEYLRGSLLLRLSQGPNPPVPWNKVGPKQVLRLFGYRLEPNPEWRKARWDQQVLAWAERLLQNPEDESRVRRFLRAWQRAFGGLDPNRTERGKALGLALEYVVYAHLKTFLQKRGGGVAPPGRLAPEEPVHNPREVDGVFWWEGSLGFVECKPRLGSAINRHREDDALWLLQERFGGLFGKGILVVRKGDWRPHERSPARLKEVLANSNLRVFSLEGRQVLAEGTVWAFPQDLPEAFRGFG